MERALSARPYNESHDNKTKCYRLQLPDWVCFESWNRPWIELTEQLEDLSQIDSWILRALDKVGQDTQTDISTPWAPDGAKNNYVLTRDRLWDVSGWGGGAQRSVQLRPVGLVHPSDVSVIRHLVIILFRFVCSSQRGSWVSLGRMVFSLTSSLLPPSRIKRNWNVNSQVIRIQLFC